jgi:hypothetical protein
MAVKGWSKRRVRVHVKSLMAVKGWSKRLGRMHVKSLMAVKGQETGFHLTHY